MGKNTGFLEYQRENNKAEAPLDRIKHFNEFHYSMNDEERKNQAARCMNCGVPFCQTAMKLNNMVSGCPLHNLIPEWNDEVYRGNIQHALSRLIKTSDFPEFTSRVCPALCEAACTCGMDSDPVTVRENEYYIIETAFANGWIKPRIPNVRTDKKVAVIGSGPSGLAVADRLNQRGHNVTVFERDDRFGGLLMYGIPNMKIEKNIVERRISLLKEEGITFIANTDIGKDVSADEIKEKFDAVVVCCGAKKARSVNTGVKNVKGIYFAVDYLKDVTKNLLERGTADESAINAKGKNVVVIGGGDTGNDCVGTSIRQGCKSVVQLEMTSKLPDERAEDNQWPQWPRVCKTDYGQQESIAVFGKDPRIYETTVKEFILDDDKNIKAVKTVNLKAVKNPKTGRMEFKEVKDSEKVIDADLVLVAAGFVGCEDYVSKAFGFEMSPANTVSTAEGKYKTSCEKVFAAGDVRRGQSLVVWAIAEGRACAKEVDEYLMGYTNMI